MRDSNLDFPKNQLKKRAGNAQKRLQYPVRHFPLPQPPLPLPPRANPRDPRASTTPSPTVDQLVRDAGLLLRNVENFNKRSCISPPDGLEVGKRSRNKSGEIAEIFKEKAERIQAVSPFHQGDGFEDPKESIFMASASSPSGLNDDTSNSEVDESGSQSGHDYKALNIDGLLGEVEGEGLEGEGKERGSEEED